MRAPCSLLCVVVVLGVGAAAAPARATSCEPVSVPTVFTFEDRTVPQNAELRFSAPFFDTVTLVGPDGAMVQTDVVSDASIVGQRLAPRAPLVAGAHVLTIESGGDPRVVNFDVDADADDDAPGAPVVTAQQSTGGSLLAYGCGCGNAWPNDSVAFSIDGADDTAVLLIDSFSELTRFGVNKTSVGENDGGVVSYDVVVRDLAGNESDATTVEVWAGCEGGCASSSALPFAAVLLALLRRRR